MSLVRAGWRLDRVRKGTSLLRRKREALVRELFQLARPAVDARTAIADEAARAYRALLSALATHGQTGLRALAWPSRTVRLVMRSGQTSGVGVAEILEHPPLERTLAARGTAPGTTGPSAVEAASRFETLVDLLLEAASREVLIRRLGEALALTSRQVHTLERRVAPDLERQMASLRQALEEREREEHLRLRHLKRRRTEQMPKKGPLDEAKTWQPQAKALA